MALKEQRTQCAKLGKKMSKMQEQINLLSVEVTPVLKDDIHDLMENNLKFFPPFMKLFWKKQNKYLSINPKAGKYHPMIIRFWLSLAAKSPSAYKLLRNSNILILPSRGHLEIKKMLYDHMQGSIDQLLRKL